MASLSINTLRRMSICKSQAWKDTQRILKRSGLVYRGERSESFDPEKHFNRYTVRYRRSIGYSETHCRMFVIVSVMAPFEDHEN